MGLFDGLAQALTPQNEFQAQNPLSPEQQAQFASQIQQSQNNFAALQSRQAQLANALQAQANGQGPNPGQAMLNQATDRNIQQNAGMISSQKGINPALAARLSGENAANMSQQAAGQGAIMGAQQQLGAQAQLGNLYSNATNQNLNNVSTSGGLTNQAALGVQGINASVAGQNAAANQATTAGLMNGAGSAAMMAALAHGGIVPHMASGGVAPTQFMSSDASQAIANQMAQQAGIHTMPTGMNIRFAVPQKTLSLDSMPGTAMAGGPMDSLGLPGSSEVGGAVGPAALVANSGAVVPGKAKVSGDSASNDTVPAMLSPGEAVIPRSVMDAPNAAEKAKEFIEHLKKQKNKKDLSYGQVLEAHRKMQEGMEMLQKCMGGKV